MEALGGGRGVIVFNVIFAVLQTYYVLQCCRRNLTASLFTAVLSMRSTFSMVGRQRLGTGDQAVDSEHKI